MRLENINTPKDGTRFLRDVYVKKFNAKFLVIPTKEGDVHRKLTEEDRKNINRIFSIQSTRQINNDFTIQFKNNWYQLTEIQPTTIRPKETILVEEWLSDSSLSGLSASPLGLPLKPLGLDGTIHFNIRGNYLNYLILPKRPERRKRQPAILTTHPLNWKPAPDHPWRKRFKQKA